MSKLPDWVTVPKVATPAMLRAAHAAITLTSNRQLAWEAMLAAAPKPATPPAVDTAPAGGGSATTTKMADPSPGIAKQTPAAPPLAKQ